MILIKIIPDKPLEDVSKGIPGEGSLLKFLKPTCTKKLNPTVCSQIICRTVFYYITSFLVGFLLHKDLKYDTLDKKFKYYQENRDEYYGLKKVVAGVVDVGENLFKVLTRMVIGSVVHNLFDPIDSIDEYMEVVESAEKRGIGQFSNNFMCSRPLLFWSIICE